MSFTTVSGPAAVTPHLSARYFSASGEGSLPGDELVLELTSKSEKFISVHSLPSKDTFATLAVKSLRVSSKASSSSSPVAFIPLLVSFHLYILLGLGRDASKFEKEDRLGTGCEGFSSYMSCLSEFTLLVGVRVVKQLAGIMKCIISIGHGIPLVPSNMVF